MNLLISFLPILSFVFLYVGSGIYFSMSNVENAFYQISPMVAIIPAIIIGWILNKGKSNEKIHQFLDGVRHPDIITMCIVFVLAGAFSAVTKEIGSVTSTVNMALSFIPAEFLLIGIFVTAAFISTAVGTSMGTIATIAPIAAELAGQGAFPPAIAMATVVGGAMFGDNLSVISDTTIASVSSQEANLGEKIKFNSKIALISAAITIAILLFSQKIEIEIIDQEYSLWLISPYILLVLLAISGLHVFKVLILAIIYSGFVGYFVNGYDIIQLSRDITNGFASMHEIMLLSLLVGGLSGLSSRSSKLLAESLSNWIAKHGSSRMAQMIMAKIASIFDILLANNTIAIIFSGEIVRNIAKKHNIPKHYAATWIDNFSCVFQGLIPYGAQILLASSIGGVSPLLITPYVFYCFVLAATSIFFICVKKI